MTRIELITSDEYIKATIECVVTGKKAITAIRAELSELFIAHKNELIEHFKAEPPIPRISYETTYDDENPDYIKGNEDGI